ncbi:50S ribosomal protein L29 [candidate division WOR-1 bacterium RIFOXYB2_FULL_42_35]|uniref:Large ribosomal subunit protein uL29 n=1 Tax=candidate division WOR-1 bacterium RIFOXYC2_FULL_41_25 TaxID=1802586 RepID=A0A1F4TMA9_UNCSA|nr:MAG: 50S ribosomal protein L29 [candidate division WOR-1 bacterium RIFOXYA2_FULL_41_14]OGC23862.1 MAG: 50S ribosomal protein L29 [candidate division WOR-1 bacterium RIFOXYB2_FULL_42_35]OGC33737.1 MAG: 50S ribosomal protein L29 [candidate division WOR-1 bacterium RIFOXYC2_FULL_41_25]OGC42508.1 MAG: 50S ribosomal protein L29 [candidate division WOR-1 bacterium RIFOXYD2_FULL_41_8]
MKTQELRELNVEELKKKAADLRRELLNARVAKANQQLKNPLKLRALRRDIARVLTVIRESENAKN